MTDDARDAYLDLAAGQPAVKHWPQRVRATVLRRRRARRLVLGGAGLALLAVPVALALSLGGQQGGPAVLAEEPTPTTYPTPTETPSPSPTATVFTQLPIVQRTGSPNPTPSDSPTARPPVEYLSRPQVIHATITGPTTLTVGEQATYTASATGDAETPLLKHFCASNQPCPTDAYFCQGHPTPTGPPAPGRITVMTTVSASSVGTISLSIEARDRCDGYPGRDDASLTIQVVAAPPTPTPTSTPAGEPTSGPTPTATPKP